MHGRSERGGRSGGFGEDVAGRMQLRDDVGDAGVLNAVNGVVCGGHACGK